MKQKGQTLIELLITIGLAAILIPALLTGFSLTREGRAQQEERLQATAYLKESEEAVRIVHSNSWNNLVNGIHHPEISGNTWILVSGSENINSNITRQVEINDVYRDSNGDIVSLGGTLDPSTKEIISSVAWNTPFPTSVSSTMYLSRYRNASYIETTVGDFTPGITNPTTTGVSITDTSGGEIVLGGGGGSGDWCNPSLEVTEVDLPKSGVANAVSAIEGKVFAGTGENASGVSYATTSFSFDNPPVATPEATFDGHKTNDVFGEENFAYLGTDTNAKEVVIINLNEYSDSPTNSKYKEEGYFNVPGNVDGGSVITSGNVGFVTSGSNLYTFDIASKTGSRPQLNNNDVILSGNGKSMDISGDYIFVASDSTVNQLQILDVSNPTSPTIVGQLTVPGQGGVAVSVNSSGTRVYLVTGESIVQDEFFIINTESKNAPVLVSGGSYDSNGMNPTGVTTVTGNRAIIVGTGGNEQYQVININNESNPLNCGGFQIATGVNGVSSVLQSNGFAYSYIITGDASAELKIILGGSGGGQFSFSGVFESTTFDPGSDVAFNTLEATASAPINTTLQYKVAIKDDVGGTCSGVIFDDNDFVGNDGTSGSYFPKDGGLIPFDNDGNGFENPSRCTRYRAYLTTTDEAQSPVIFDIGFNYSL